MSTSRSGAHREDCLVFLKRVMFYWSWAGGLVLIMRTACCSRLEQQAVLTMSTSPPAQDQ
jgi:hypothetical protein